MQNRQDDLKRGAVFLLVHAGRYASPVVSHADGVVRKDLDINSVAEAGHGFIDTVVNHLIYKMMQSPLGDISYIHGRTLADCLQSLKHLYAVGGVLLFRLLHIVFIYHLSIVK